MLLIVVLIWLGLITQYTNAEQRPNILFILSDDHGWNDVDWHDPTMDTPNLNKLAHSEHTVQLDRAYVNQCCSPTRSALLSGYYPYHLGLQEGVILELDPAGVSLNFKLLPETLLTLGYNTYMVGKWHLGYCKRDYLPTRRGFEKFYGYYNGQENYYSHVAELKGIRGLDLNEDTYDSFIADWSKRHKYSTTGVRIKNMRPTPQSSFKEVFTNETIAMLQNHTRERPFFCHLALQAVHSPLQPAPAKYAEGKCSNITRRDRRIYCGMVNALDYAVGRVVDELKALDFYNNTIIIFGSDNGGQVHAGGNNYPLRGNKDTLWEGGTRINSFVHSPAHIQSHAVRTKMFNVVDWYATILGMIGQDIDEYGDGYNLWDMIKNDSSRNNRRRFVYNIKRKSAAIREGAYKLIVGEPGEPSGWIPPNKESAPKPWRYKNQTIWLFNVDLDPNEQHDLSLKKPLIVHELMEQLRKWSLTSVPSILAPFDYRGNPNNFNGTFSPGWC